MNNLSIVIVNWNTGNRLWRAIETLHHGGEEASTELRVVEHASSNASANFLRRLGQRARLLGNVEDV